MTADATALPPGYRLFPHDTLPSTNDEAKRLARQDEAEGAVVWAREQTAGRGRRGRTWLSPRGNLSLSLMLRPREPAAKAAQLGFATALALAEALDDVVPSGLEIRLKWPNDVLVNGRKLAGILLESETASNGRLEFLIIGVGANLAIAPQGTEFPSTSLTAEGVHALDPQRLLALFVSAFDRWLQRWRQDGFGPLRTAWLARAAARGETVRVRLERESYDGRFLGLDDDGALVLEQPAGLRRVQYGEVFPAAG
ncbi:MAG TPA: biotin--[acetyl-CoA-carboxylase] ligase [Stellaceae bacterium]|nr:biotin--[acetyl-CoA-carboxylase] ligase [Stellaceae bacterium]